MWRTRPEVGADDGRAEVPELGRDDPAAGPACHRLDEAGKPGVLAEPEERRLGAEPGRGVELAHRQREGAGVGRVVEEHLAAGLEVRRRLAVGDDEQHGLLVRVPAEVPVREEQRVVEVGALLPHRVERRELLDPHDLRVPPEPDELEVVPPEPAGDQLVEREGGALHRDPPPVHRHREGRVDEQRDRRPGAGLGLGHLDVTDVEPDAVTPVRRLGRRPRERVGHRAGHVPGLGVAELPGPGGAARLAGRPRRPHVTGTLPGGQPPGDVPQEGAAELAHGPGREPQGPVGRSGEVAAVAQGALELRERAGVDGGLVADLPGERVEVDVVHPGAGVGLRELVGERVELRDVLEHPGAVTEAQPLLPAELLRPVPVLARAERPQGVVQCRQLVHEPG